MILTLRLMSVLTLMLIACNVHAAETLVLTPGQAKESTTTLDLSGEWEFQLDPDDVGRAELWFDQGKPFERKMPVPAAWNAHGAAYESEAALQAYEQKFLNGRDVVAGPESETERLFSVFPGPAWYRRTVHVPEGWKNKLLWLNIDGVHREAEVWVNGNLVGSHHSYLIPCRLDISRFAKAGEKATVVIRVDARRNPDKDPLMGCLDTVDFVYASWGGLYKRVSLEATDRTWIDNVFVAPNLEQSQAAVSINLTGHSTGKLEIQVDIADSEGTSVSSSRRSLPAQELAGKFELNIPEVKLWSPKSPHLYSANITLLENERIIDTRIERFGMREFKVAGGKFLLNGEPIFLRGYGDDCIYPNTICPPDDEAEFRRRLSMARDYGFNFVRHHSWVPPKAYMDVADELGMMIQPEFPFAYRGNLPVSDNMWKFALEQWKQMITLYRNHPSIVAWCMGNELYDTPHHEAEWYQAAKEIDPTRPVIDTDGCNFSSAQRASLDYLVVPFDEGNSIGFNDGKYNVPPNITKPVVGHEMGYFVTLHDLSQIPLFDNGVRPYWLYKTRDLVAGKGLGNQYAAWLKASYQLQSVCLKTNMEAARRSSLQGAHVWLFQDYPNCAEGVVDMFFRPKDTSADEFRRYNSPTVLLLDTPRRSWWNDETANLKVLVSRYEDQPSENATLTWELECEDQVLTSGSYQHLRIDNEGVQPLVSLELTMPRQKKARKLTLHAELSDENGKRDNSWDFWFFPRERTLSKTAAEIRFTTDTASLFNNMADEASEWSAKGTGDNPSLLVSGQLDQAVMDYLTSGGSVLLTSAESSFNVEKTNFRLSSWDGGGPSGTISNVNHPLMSQMPTDGWCDLQFYPLIQGSKTVMLDSITSGIEPIVRCVDRPNRLANRAYLFEARVGQGKLLVSGFNFAEGINSGDPAAIFFLRRLTDYARSSAFKPASSLTFDKLTLRAQ